MVAYSSIIPTLQDFTSSINLVTTQECIINQEVQALIQYASSELVVTQTVVCPDGFVASTCKYILT